MSDGPNIGFAALQVIPSMKGIQGKLAAELGGPAEAAAGIAGEKAGISFGSRLSSGAKKTAAGVTAIAGLVGAVGGGLFAIGDKFDSAFDKIAVGTGKTGPALAALKNDFREVVRTVPTDFGSASTAITEINQRLGLTGPLLQERAAQFAELSHITGTELSGNITSVSGAFNNFSVAAKDQGADLDLLFRASQASGISIASLTDSMQQGGPVLRQLGFDFGDAAGFIAGLGKRGVDVSQIFPAMSKAIATAAKEGKSASQVYRETFAAIKNAPSDTAAAAVAMDVFGQRAGPKLAALIREGKFSLDTFIEGVVEGKSTITSAAADTADFSEKFDLFKNKALLALEPIATRVFNLVGGLIDKFNGLSPGFQQAIIIGGGVVLVFGTLAAAITVLGPGLAAIGAGIAFLVSPVGLVVAGIALLAAGVIYAYTHFKFFHDAVDTVGRILADVFGWVKDNWPLLLAILTGPIGLAVKFIIDHWEGVKAVFSGIVNFVRDHWSLIFGIITGPIGLAVKFVTDHFNDIVGFFAGMPGRIAAAAAGMWDGIKNAFRGVINTIIGWWNGLQFTLPKVHVPGTPIDIGGFTLGTPDIPKLHGGGIYRAPGGAGEGFALLRDGETVLTPMQAADFGVAGGDGASARPLVVHTHVELDGEEVGYSVDTYQFDSQRGATRG